MNNKLGFTLIELLVVISIIGVLTALLLPNLVGIRSRAADTSIKNNLTQMKTSLRLYYNDYQSYPGDNGSGALVGCGTANPPATVCAEGGTFSAGSPAVIYMKQLPEDFFYDQTPGGEGFLISAELENASDSDIADSAAKCGQQAPSSGDLTYYVCSD